MDQQVIAIICLCVVVASLVGSYVKYRRKGVDPTEKQTQSVSEIMDDAFSYFGVERSRGDGVSRALDLMPLELAGDMMSQKSRKARSGGKKR